MTFIEYFNQTVCKVKIVRKDKSLFMRLLGLLLALSDKLKITNIQDFNSYVTTVGNRIYAPASWSSNMLPNAILLHELTHVLESKYYTFYYIGYLLSKKKRAFYESICIQTELLYGPKCSEGFGDLRREATILKGYGCHYKDTLKELRARVDEIRKGRPSKCAKEVYEAYDEWVRSEFTKKAEAQSASSDNQS